MQTNWILRVSVPCRFQSFKGRAVLIAIKFEKYVLRENIRDIFTKYIPLNSQLAISHRIKTSLFISSIYPNDVERLFSHLNVYLNVPFVNDVTVIFLWTSMHSNWRPISPLNHMWNAFILSCDDLQAQYSCGVLWTIWICSSKMLFN